MKHSAEPCNDTQLVGAASMYRCVKFVFYALLNNSLCVVATNVC